MSNYHRQYYQQNKIKIQKSQKEYHKIYYKKNRQSILEKQKANYQAFKYKTNYYTDDDEEELTKLCNIYWSLVQKILYPYEYEKILDKIIKDNNII